MQIHDLLVPEKQAPANLAGNCVSRVWSPLFIVRNSTIIPIGSCDMPASHYARNADLIVPRRVFSKFSFSGKFFETS